LDKAGYETARFLEMKDLYGLAGRIKDFELKNVNKLHSGTYKDLNWESFASNPKKMLK